MSLESNCGYFPHRVPESKTLISHSSCRLSQTKCYSYAKIPLPPPPYSSQQRIHPRQYTTHRSIGSVRRRQQGLYRPVLSAAGETVYSYTDRAEDQQHDLQGPDGRPPLVVVGKLVQLLEQQITEPGQVLVRTFLPEQSHRQRPTGGTEVTEPGQVLVRTFLPEQSHRQRQTGGTEVTESGQVLVRTFLPEQSHRQRQTGGTEVTEPGQVLVRTFLPEQSHRQRQTGDSRHRGHRRRSLVERTLERVVVS